MLKSLNSRILFSIAGIVLLTAAAIIILVEIESKDTLENTLNDNAFNLLNTVVLNIDNEYQSLLFHKERTLAGRKRELRNIIDVVFTRVRSYYQKYKEGKLSEKEAKRRAINEIKGIRYDKNVGYIWINDIGRPIPKMIMHPTIPELDGEVLDDPRFNCALGKGENLFIAFVDVCLKNGDGYVDYLWPKPSQDGLTDDQPKISYVRLFEEWGWVIGTGLYIDDIEKENSKKFASMKSELRKTFKEIKNNVGGSMFVFNSQKEMLIHHYNGKINFSNIVNPETGAKLLDEIISAVNNGNNKLDYTWVKKTSSGSQAKYKKRLYAKYFDKLDWYVCISFYVKDINEPIHALAYEMLLLSIIILSIALFLSITLSKSVSKPIQKLAAAAGKINEKGLKKIDIPIIGASETKKLGRILSQMLNAIQVKTEEWERLSKILENTSDIVSMAQPDQKIIYLNKAGYDVLGITDIEGLLISDIHPESTYKKLSDEAIPCAIEKGIWLGETEIKTVAGDILQVSQIFLSHKDSQGKIKYFSTMVRDITDRKKYEEELRFKDKIIRTTSSCIATSTNEGVITYVNPAFLEVWGYDNEEQVVGRHFSEFWDISEIINDVMTTMMIGGGWNGEIKAIRPDGSLFDVQIQANTIRTPDGLPIGLMASSLDISERKLFEESIQLERDAYMRIFNGTPSIVCGVTPDGIINFINPAGERITGYSKEELLGKNASEMFYPGKYYEQIEPLLANDKNFELMKDFEIALLSKDKKEKIISWNILSREDEDGSVIEIISFGNDITEKKNAEKRLIESEQRYKLLFDNAENYIGMYNYDGVCLLMNNLLAESYGRKPQELIGHSLHEMLPKQAAEFVNRIRKAYDTGDSSEFIDMVEFPVGDKYLLSKTVPVKNLEGKIVAVQLLSMDITDKTLAEKALRDSKTQFHHLVSNIPGVVFHCKNDENWTMLFLSDYFEELTGYPASSFINNKEKAYIDIIHEKDKIMINNRIQEAIQYKKSYAIEYRITDSQGLIHWVFEKGKGYYDENGELYYIDGAIFDISDQKLAEEALRESESLYRGIIQNIQDVYYRTDSEGVIIMFSPSGLATLGYNHVHEIIGKKLADDFYVNPDERKKFLEDLQEKGALKNYEVMLKKKDNTPFPILTSSHYYYDENGKPLGVEGVFTDITERKAAELEIRKLNEGLEQRVKERTAELEALNEELDNFAYIVSHDLKAPLRGISQLAQWLAQDHSDQISDDGMELMKLLIRRVHYLNQLVDGILKYSRAGRMKGDIVEIDIESLVIEVIEIIAPPDHIKIEINDTLPVILYDKIKLEQIFQNLLSNAVKYIDKPEGKISITCIDLGKYWKFGITDNGPGIDPKYHEKIFGVFQTLESKENADSTGIGLSIVKKVIEYFGGKVWIESVLGQGSTFYFTVLKNED